MSDIEYESDDVEAQEFTSDEESEEGSEVDFEELELDGSDEEEETTTTIVTRTGDDRTSSNVLSNFDISKLVGIRAEQINMGAKTVLSRARWEALLNRESGKIARRELELGIIPIDIIRTFPGGRVQDRWQVGLSEDGRAILK